MNATANAAYAVVTDYEHIFTGETVTEIDYCDDRAAADAALTRGAWLVRHYAKMPLAVLEVDDDLYAAVAVRLVIG